MFNFLQISKFCTGFSTSLPSPLIWGGTGVGLNNPLNPPRQIKGRQGMRSRITETTIEPPVFKKLAPKLRLFPLRKQPLQLQALVFAR